MRTGIFAQGQEGMTWDQWTALAAAVERHGFESLLISDHYRSYRSDRELGGLDAFATLAGLAVGTTRIRLGTLVSPALFRHPSVTAKMSTTIDHISDGRFELGLGAGWSEDEHREHGFPFPATRERLDLAEEQLTLIRRLWTEPEVRTTGGHYELAGAVALPKPVQRCGPPLLMGGAANPRSLRSAVRWADEYNTPFVTPEECARRRGLLEDECLAQGRAPGTMVFSVLLGFATDEGAAEEHREADGWLTGSAPEIGGQLDAYRRAGADRVHLMPGVHDDLTAIAELGAVLTA